MSVRTVDLELASLDVARNGLNNVERAEIAEHYKFCGLCVDRRCS
jgi:hypothetical protein